MAETEDSVENVDNPFSSLDFSDSDPPSPEQLLAMLERLSGLSNVDRNEVLQELLKQTPLTEAVEPVQQILTSQFLVLLALFLTIATVFGKKFRSAINKLYVAMTLIPTSCNLVFTVFFGSAFRKVFDIHFCL
jgi:hypothetical protein